MKFLTLRCHLKFSKFNLNKHFINFHHFENSSNYYPNNGIHLKVFEFPQHIPSSKHTLKEIMDSVVKSSGAFRPKTLEPEGLFALYGVNGIG